MMVLASRVCPPPPPPLALTAGGVFGVATKTPSSASAMTEAAATTGTGFLMAGRPRRFSPDSRPADRTAKAATSMIPAMMPEVVRTSVKPNRPTLSDSRYPARVPIANPAPAAYASR